MLDALKLAPQNDSESDDDDITSRISSSSTEEVWKRHLSPASAFKWLAAGWRDLTVQPATSLGYGVVVFLDLSRDRRRTVRARSRLHSVSRLRRLHGGRPVLAIGLYEKSRRIAAGEPV